MLGISRDVEDDLVARLREAQERADMLLTSAGVSVGDYDFTKKVLSQEGEINFWQVRMRPGKPLAFGRVGSIPHLGLPGNPVSAMLAFELFGRPALLKMMGKIKLRRPEVEAILHGAVENRDGRRSFYRVFVLQEQGEWHARLTGPQGSGILTSMALANGLLVIPEEVRRAQEGDRVRVMMLDWPEEAGG
jgi:molybdopterin molybdotransferase